MTSATILRDKRGLIEGATLGGEINAVTITFLSGRQLIMSVHNADGTVDSFTMKAKRKIEVRHNNYQIEAKCL